VLCVEWPDHPKWMSGATVSDCGRYLFVSPTQGPLLLMPGHDMEFIKLNQLCIVSNVYLGHFWYALLQKFATGTEFIEIVIIKGQWYIVLLLMICSFSLSGTKHLTSIIVFLIFFRWRRRSRVGVRGG
jgi:hypothetical protein